jgi:hypothetical protein
VIPVVYPAANALLDEWQVGWAKRVAEQFDAEIWRTEGAEAELHVYPTARWDMVDLQLHTSAPGCAHSAGRVMSREEIETHLDPERLARWTALALLLDAYESAWAASD